MTRRNRGQIPPILAFQNYKQTSTESVRTVGTQSTCCLLLVCSCDPMANRGQLDMLATSMGCAVRDGNTLQTAQDGRWCVTSTQSMSTYTIWTAVKHEGLALPTTITFLGSTFLLAAASCSAPTVMEMALATWSAYLHGLS